MKMWADEEGVGVGSLRMRKGGKEGGEKEKIIIKQISPKKFEINNKDQKIIVVQNSPSADEIHLVYKDRYNNTYFNSMGMKGIDRGFIKISPNGMILAVIRDWKYRVEDIWKDDCGNRPQPLLGNWEKSMIFNKKGDLYFIEAICCQKQTECINKIRVVKISKGE